MSKYNVLKLIEPVKTNDLFLNPFKINFIFQVKISGGQWLLRLHLFQYNWSLSI